MLEIKQERVNSMVVILTFSKFSGENKERKKKTRQKRGGAWKEGASGFI